MWKSFMLISLICISGCFFSDSYQDKVEDVVLPCLDAEVDAITDCITACSELEGDERVDCLTECAKLDYESIKGCLEDGVIEVIEEEITEELAK